jgi:hypothetical protein
MIGLAHNYRITFRYAIRADLKYRAIFMLGALLVFITLYSGYILREVERPYVIDDGVLLLNMKYLTNGWWLSIVTVSSVGYGGFPVTHLGRLICGGMSAAGVYYMSLCIVAMMRYAVFNSKEMMSYWALKDRCALVKHHTRAGKIVLLAFKIKYALRLQKV